MGSPTADKAFALVLDFSNFQWYMVVFLLIIIYMIAKELQKGNFSALLAALGLWLMDWINEIWNALIYYFSGFAPFWSTPPGPSGPNSSLVILVGLNIEITFMFFMMGIVSTKMFKGTIQEELAIADLTEQKLYRKKRILNRIVMILSMTALCVIVEIVLNLIGVLVWEWTYIWSIYNPVLIYLIGYLPFWGMSALIYDMKKRSSQIITVGILVSIVVAGLVIFGSLGWLTPQTIV